MSFLPLLHVDGDFELVGLLCPLSGVGVHAPALFRRLDEARMDVARFSADLFHQPGAFGNDAVLGVVLGFHHVLQRQAHFRSGCGEDDVVGAIGVGEQGEILSDDGVVGIVKERVPSSIGGVRTARKFDAAGMGVAQREIGEKVCLVSILCHVEGLVLLVPAEILSVLALQLEAVGSAVVAPEHVVAYLLHFAFGVEHIAHAVGEVEIVGSELFEVDEEEGFLRVVGKLRHHVLSEEEGTLGKFCGFSVGGVGRGKAQGVFIAALEEAARSVGHGAIVIEGADAPENLFACVASVQPEIEVGRFVGKRVFGENEVAAIVVAEIFPRAVFQDEVKFVANVLPELSLETVGSLGGQRGGVAVHCQDGVVGHFRHLQVAPGSRAFLNEVRIDICLLKEKIVVDSAGADIAIANPVVHVAAIGIGILQGTSAQTGDVHDLCLPGVGQGSELHRAQDGGFIDVGCGLHLRAVSFQVVSECADEDVVAEVLSIRLHGHDCPEFTHGSGGVGTDDVLSDSRILHDFSGVGEAEIV